MTGLLLLFGMKLADSMLATMKSVFTYQGREYWAMFAVTGSQLVYLLLVTQMTNTVASFVVVGIAVMAGQFLGMRMGEKMRKESVWRIDSIVLFNEGIEFADKLKELNIPCTTTTAYMNGNKVLKVTAYAENRSQTSLVKSQIPVGSIVDVIEIKNHITT